VAPGAKSRHKISSDKTARSGNQGRIAQLVHFMTPLIF
jgi:hypothetical protein